MATPTLKREELEADVLDFLYARLNAVWRPGVRSVDALTSFLERLAAKPADLAHLAIIYHLFRPDGAEQFFIDELPAALNRLSHSITRARTTGRRVGRGQIVWSETLVRQCGRSDPTVFVVNQAVKEYDTPFNRLLAHYVHEVWMELDRIGAAGRGRLGAVSEAIITNSQEALRSAYLREARSITAVTASMLSAASRSKHAVYWRAADLWRELEDLQNAKDISRLREILKVGWIGPLVEEDLFEIYVLVRVLRALENTLGQGCPVAAEYNLVGRGSTWIGKLTGEDWIGTVHFDAAPHNSFHPLFDENDYEYKTLLAHYGGAAAAARRPDISVLLRRKADGLLLPILIEVKNTSLHHQYGRDSIYKVFGYLADFKKLWAAERAATRPRAVLVLRDGVDVDDEVAALREEVVLVSPPDLTARLEGVFTAALSRAPDT
ncbi:hypothetical protein ABIG06_005650 [Bradyrhizobium sp. USDA 326]|uniref:hypothetical protein n=1 Tax=Bradyrhizobium sp. USDA 326 TaxID=3377726 RepID=UPI003C7499CF